jgi:hypothetical protein
MAWVNVFNVVVSSLTLGKMVPGAVCCFPLAGYHLGDHWQPLTVNFLPSSKIL